MLTSFIYLIICTVTIIIHADQVKWNKFKSDFGKSYDMIQLENERFKIFEENLRLIASNNEKFKNGEVSYKLGINQFTDVSKEEFRSSIKLFNKFDRQPLRVEPHPKVRGGYCTGEEPESYDWRDSGGLSDIKDQREFYDGYSWAFSVTAAVETQVFLSIHTLVPLSAQNLIDCVAPIQNATGWLLDFAFEYLLSEGILTEDEYPYTGSVGTCQQDTYGIVVGLYVDLIEECEIKTAIAEDGPVTVVIDASYLSNYESGIIDDTLCSKEWDDLNHSVLVVGYGTEDGVNYWIVRNSWGSQWGEEGHFRIKYGNNTCGIALSPSYPIILHN